MFRNIAQWQEEKLESVVERFVQTYVDDKGINHIDGLNLPRRKDVYEILDILFRVFYPGYVGGESVRRSNQRFYVGEMLTKVADLLQDQIYKALKYRCRMEQCSQDACACDELGTDMVARFMDTLPEMREMLKDDLEAAYEGDPAAMSLEEICTSYPFIHVITTHRVAHALYQMHLPLIPRMMSERAHAETGVDIHPGADIGRHFFIDHGTGVVIGETTHIGDNVKIYQGVTLGALSFPKDAQGNIIKGGKRHPTIEDNVTIYAGATILGGDTVIGEGAVIGGNTWITHSIPRGALVIIDKEGRQTIREKNG